MSIGYAIYFYASLGRALTVPVVSNNRWVMAGAGATIGSEIIVYDLSSGNMGSSWIPSDRLVLPPSIGLDGYWFTVELGGTLRGFDTPALEEGPLPPEKEDGEPLDAPGLVQQGTPPANLRTLSSGLPLTGQEGSRLPSGPFK